MVNLTHLSLSNCGVNITDFGILTISQIPNINVLYLSWLINVTDTSLSHIASNCKTLKYMYLEGCDGITSEGVRRFAHHPTLKHLALFSCRNIPWEDVANGLSVGE